MEQRYFNQQLNKYGNHTAIGGEITIKKTELKNFCETMIRIETSKINHNKNSKIANQGIQIISLESNNESLTKRMKHYERMVDDFLNIIYEKRILQNKYDALIKITANKFNTTVIWITAIIAIAVLIYKFNS